jgi:hypothetical protein
MSVSLNLVAFNLASSAELHASTGQIPAFGDDTFADYTVHGGGLLQPFTGDDAPKSLLPVLQRHLRLQPRLRYAEELVWALNDGDGFANGWWLFDTADKLKIIAAYQAALQDCRLLPKSAALISYLLNVARPTVALNSGGAGGGGNNQTHAASGDFTNPISVLVTDSFGSPVIGASVHFVSNNGHVTVTTSPAVTNGSGVAQSVIHAFSTGVSLITASVLGSSSSFVFTETVS